MHISAYKMRMLKVQRASAQTPPPGAKQPRLEPQSTQSEVLLSEFKPPPLEAAARHGLDRVRRVESPNLCCRTNPRVSSGEMWPQPCMAVVNNDYRAAQMLPHAASVIDELLRQRQEHIATTKRLLALSTRSSDAERV